jgi:hypothetical protein
VGGVAGIGAEHEHESGLDVVLQERLSLLSRNTAQFWNSVLPHARGRGACNRWRHYQNVLPAPVIPLVL